MIPNPFDQASRYTAKLDPLGLLRWLLLRLAATIHFRLWLDARTLPFPGHPDRTCDTVAGLVDDAAPDRWWALPIEFQHAPDPEMFGRLLEYLGRLWRELRPPGPPSNRFDVAAVVVNLTGRGQSSRRMKLGKTGLETALQVGECNLEQEDAAATLRGIARRRVARCILPWIPLMHGGGEAAIIAQWKRVAEAEPDARRRADYGGLALVFAELAACRLEWKSALEGWNVEQSVQVLEWQAQAYNRGKAEGIAEGKAEGIAEGKAEGIAEGKAEGIAEGKAEGKAEAVLHLAERRLGKPVPAALAAQIRATTDLAKLNQWFDATIDLTSPDDFRRLVQG
jgi:hypothetical protein